MRTILAAFAIILAGTLSVSAQTRDRGKTVLGKVVDSENGEPLISSSVALMKPDTTTLVTGDVTGSTGGFSIKNVKSGKYIVKVSYVGYHNFYKSIEIKDSVRTSNIGTVLLTPNSVMLEAAVVKGQAAQVEVKEDTLIFNAAAFKVPEGSVLEELIRKIPGAEVSDDGTIKVNGKTVKKILVEGKEFFSNQTSMAMKNIPSEIVEKVKAYDKQSDLARITGIDDGEEETVLDLSIKKGMKQGWFGNLDAAYGTEDRFSEKLNVNRFKDNTQASFIGSYNNINDRSFPGGGGRGRGGNGITTSGMGGLNFALERKNVEVGGNVRYINTKSDSRTYTSSQNFVTTNASFSNSMRNSISHNGTFSGNFKIEWKPDSMSRVLFRPNFSIGNSDSESNGVSATFNADPYSDNIQEPLSQIEEIDKAIRINRNTSSSLSEQNNWSFNASLLYNRKLNSKGRNLSATFSGGYTSSKSKSYSMSDVIYYQRNDSTSLTYRHRDTPNTSKNLNAGFTYSEPIANKTYLQLNYRFQYSMRHSDGRTFDLGDIINMRDSLYMYGTGFLPFNYSDYLDADLSKYTDNENYIHNIDLSLKMTREKYLLNVGMSINPQTQKVDYNYQGLDTVASRNFFRMSPTLNFRYRFSKQHQLQVRYRGNTQQPEITDMFNMTDNSDPLNIRMGNPGLKPSFTNNVNVSYNNYMQESRRSVMANFSFSNTLNSISNRTAYNEETGGRTTRPENINGNWSTNANVGFNTPLFTEKFIVNTSTSGSFNNNVGFIYQDRQTLKNTVKNMSLGERMSLTWREEFFDIVLNGSISYNHSRSNLVTTNNRDTYDFFYGISGNANLNNGIAFSTNIGMSSRRGYSSNEMNTNELVWNAQASYRFLKNKQATISLQANDILHTMSNISRSISATSRSDSETNAINSYAMLHFIYRLNMFGNKQARSEMRGERMKGGERMGRERF
ncbi:MAG: outer membrane beta-barrel protein [Bacteroides sp.]|nr:outer membrane beta-barrel protein [Roseburia sp.]MCM1346253.1 outer membrane beta-barrel protein [Bacteroides sp.]MCM1420826.1 outer membrane beta-barrel protein [Bacteroides sp.]